MQKQDILPVLYDLSLTIGDQINLKSLLTSTLQRLLFHTSFSAGFISLNIPDESDSNPFPPISIDAAVGDLGLIKTIDKQIKVPRNLIYKKVEEATEQKQTLELIPEIDKAFYTFVRLPLNKQGIIILLAKVNPEINIDLELVLQPVLSQLGKAIILCRNNDLHEAQAREERTQLKKSLSRIESQYQSLIAFSPIGISLVRAGKIIQGNVAFSKLFGYETVSDLIGKSISEIVRTKNQNDTKDIAEKIGETNRLETDSKESIGIRKDGSQFPVMVNSSEVSTEKDPFSFTFVLDLTEQKRIEKKLVSTNEILRLIVETAPVRIFWKDNQSRYLGCNHAFAKDAGKDNPEDLIGMTDSQLNWKEQAKDYVSDDSYVISTKKSMLNYEEVQSTPEGKLKYLRTSKVPLFDSEGEIRGILGVYDDITGQKIIENELIALNKTLEERVFDRTKKLSDANDRLLTEMKERKEVTQQFEIVVKSIPNSIILVDEAGVIRYINPQTEIYFGYSESELIGQKIEKIVPHKNVEDHEKLREQYMKDPVARSIKAFSILHGKRKDGSLIPVEIGLNPIRLNQKTLILASILDISERIKIEKEKKDLAFRFELAMRAGGIGLGEFDFVQNIMKWDDQLYQLYGVKKEKNENPYDAWRSGLHPEDIDRVDREMQEAIKEKREFNSDFRIVWPDGRIRFIRALARIINDDSGNPIKLVGTNYDITKLKKTELELKESNEKLIHFIKNSPVYAYIKEVSPEESRVVIASDNFHEMIGISSSDMVNKNMYELFPAEFAKKITADDWDVVSGGKILTTREDLGEKNYITIKFPLILGSSSLLAGYAIDITDRVQSEENLKKARIEAEDANRMKSEFLANMSHEIRTPLNAIVGFSTILEEKAEGNKLFTEYLHNIIQSSNVLLGLINDILDLSKVEAGRMVVSLSSVNLKSLIHEILAIFSLKAKDKGITLIATVAEEVPNGIVTDEKFLRQIFFNLVGNAVKFTHEGSVEIRVSGVPQFDNKNKIDLQITIRDSGIGIPENEVSKIFEPFRQVGRQNRNIYGGTGLGLSITRRLVELLGGTISVKSVLGKGSIFQVSLENTEVTGQSIEENFKSSFSKVSQIRFHKPLILITEDVNSNRKILKLYLETHAVKIIEATNGEECIKMARDSKPDLILMDLQMPVMNGYDATLQIKADPILKNIPIIGLSASGLGPDKDQFEAVVETFLLKPLHKDELIEALMKHLPYEVESLPEENNQTKIDLPDSAEDTEVLSDEVKTQLKEKYLPTIQKLQSNLNFDNLIAFELDLENFMKTNNSDSLKKFCSALKDSIESFNIEKIYSTLVALSVYIKGKQN